MNALGNIMVVVNMLLALLFFAIAGATFQANTKTRATIAGLKDKATKAEKDRSTIDQDLALARNDLGVAKAKIDELTQKLAFAANDATKQQEALRDEAGAVRKELATTNQRLLMAKEEVGFRKQEVDDLRNRERDLNKELKTRSDEIAKGRDDLALTKNELEIAKDKLRQLASTEQALRRILADKGVNVPNDPKELEAKLTGKLPTPEIVGKIVKVDGKFATIDLGENDGLRPGMTMDAWRMSPLPKYLGEVRVFSTQPSRAVVTGANLVATLEAADNVGKSPLLHR